MSCGENSLGLSRESLSFFLNVALDRMRFLLSRSSLLLMLKFIV